MKRYAFLVLIFTLVWMLAAPPCPAGEMVNDEMKEWAREALKKETDQSADYAPDTLAVLYFKNGTQNAELDPLSKGLAVMLITDLSKIEEIQVVERVRLQALMEEMALGASGLVTVDTAPRVGRLLGAQYLVGGDFAAGKKATDIRISSDLLDVPSEESLRQPVSEGALEELFRLEKEILFEIVDRLKIELTPEQKEKLRVPLSTNKKALLAFFKGIDSSDRGEYEKAAVLYEEALNEDPDLSPARDALMELNTAGLVTSATIAALPPESTEPEPEPRKTRPMLRGLRSKVSQNNQLQPTSSTKRLRTPDEVIATGTADVVVDWQ